jgi:hypothetical protein
MILLWGIPEDSPLAVVRAALHQRRAPTFVVDQYAVLETSLELTVGAEIRARLRVGSRSCDLSHVTAAYIRPYESRRLLRGKAAGEGSAAWRHAEELDEGLTLWSELTSALVVNRIEAMAGNGSKPYQALQIRSSGFDVPDTLITTDPAAAAEFWERHGVVVYKSVSSVRSIVSRLMPEHRDRLADIQWCPTQFQAYVPGTDVRVHVVGKELFACEILSDADDYRYPARQGGEASIHPYALPDECADRCLALATEMELLVAGIDLRRTPDGRWFCFEVNPSPGFTYYQNHTGHPIDQAIAELLLSVV